MAQLSLTDALAALTAITSIIGFTNEKFYNQWIMNPYRVHKRKEYYRFVSSGFIHLGWMHLIFNLITFYFFGKEVEIYFNLFFGPAMGKVYFVALYLLGIVVSDVPTYLRYKNYPHYHSLGASGGVSGVIFASILYSPLSNLCLYGFLCLPGFIWGVVYIIYSYVYDRQGSGQINHSAHLYGALFGFVFAAVLRPMALVDFFAQISRWSMF